jgi:hypothetical protein
VKELALALSQNILAPFRAITFSDFTKREYERNPRKA